MHVLLVFFSNTGNTRHIGTELRSALEAQRHSVSLRCLTTPRDRAAVPPSLFVSADAVVIASPVHARAIPRPLADYLADVLAAFPHAVAGKPVAAVVTHAGHPGHALQHITAPLVRAKALVRATAAVLMPDSYPVGFPSSAASSLRHQPQLNWGTNDIRDAHASLAALAAKLGDPEALPAAKSPFILAMPTAFRWAVKAKMGPIIVDTGLCIRCEACVRACSQGCIELRGRVIVQDFDACCACWSCFHVCPKEAISASLAIVPPTAPRYRFSNRVLTGEAVTRQPCDFIT
jgi:NAD-dependent dihydropyrimidine dehydrogenase PreA subunit